jgi:predicted MFS family arabinose efflux permease
VPDPRLPVRATVVLGLVTIVGFGVWFYGYGVLLEPIRADTGWSEAALTSTYGVSLFGAGILATVVGRLLHRRGARGVYAVGAAFALGGYLAASVATSELTFAVAAVLAGSVTGALGYYAAVHTAIAQLVGPEGRARAITTNTLWGAFASPVFLPLMAWLVLRLDWRVTLQVTGVTVAVAFVLVAAFVPDGRGPEDDHLSLRASLAAAGRDRVVVALLATTFLSGLATSVLILYQVPVMVAAGLTLAVASGLAGARGFLQLAGRLPMPWLVRRFGSRATLRWSHLLTAVSCLLLPLAGTLPTAVLFAVVAGVAIGALVPVESIFSADAVDGSSLGVVLGIASLTRGVGAALGPVVGGTLSQLLGTRTPTLVLIAVAAGAAAWLVPRATHRTAARPAP